MPPLVEAGEPLGRVTEGPDRLRGAILTLAGHDHQAAALGAGVTAAGDELDSCGTAEALLRTVPPTLTRDQIRWLAERGVTTDWSVVPGHWSLLAATEGGLAMERALALLGVDRAGLRALDRAAADAPAGRITVEGIGGEALSIGGITEHSTPGEVWRAVVEAVTADAVRLHRGDDRGGRAAPRAGRHRRLGPQRRAAPRQEQGLRPLPAIRDGRGRSPGRGAARRPCRRRTRPHESFPEQAHP